MIFYNGFSEKEKAFFIERHIKHREECVRKYRKSGHCDFIEQVVGKRNPLFWEMLVVEDLHCYYTHGQFLNIENVTENELRIQNKSRSLSEEDIFIIRKVVALGQESHVRYVEELEQRVELLSKENETYKALEKERKRNEQTIFDETKIQAQAILQNAHSEADAILASAQQMLAEKENTCKQTAQALTDKYLTEHHKQMRTECETMMADYYLHCKEAAGNADRIHTQMCDRTSELQAAWVNRLDATFEALTALKFDLYHHLREWQTLVCGNEYRAIAQCHRELYRIVNTDKLITETILEAEKIGADGTLDGIIVSLLKLEKKLTTFLRKFEQSLGGLGLYVYYPAAGEEWNEVKHVCDEENVDNAVITECIMPGIAYKTSQDEDGDVILAAYVKTQCREDIGYEDHTI